MRPSNIRQYFLASRIWHLAKVLRLLWCRFMVSQTPISGSIVIGSIPSASADICNRILSDLKAKNFSKEDIFAVHLALEEAFINAIRHGNKMNPDKKVKVDYSVGSEEVEITMTDEGGGFEPNSVPDPRCGENIYKTDGRGLFLVRAYMDVVEFNERGNQVRMVRHRSEGANSKSKIG